MSYYSLRNGIHERVVFFQQCMLISKILNFGYSDTSVLNLLLIKKKTLGDWQFSDLSVHMITEGSNFKVKYKFQKVEFNRLAGDLGIRVLEKY